MSDSFATPWTIAHRAPLSMDWILQARILEWVAIPFSRGSSWPRDRTGVSHIAGRFFTVWATRQCLLIKAKGRISKCKISSEDNSLVGQNNMQRFVFLSPSSLRKTLPLSPEITSPPVTSLYILLSSCIAAVCIILFSLIDCELHEDRKYILFTSTSLILSK